MIEKIEKLKIKAEIDLKSCISDKDFEDWRVNYLGRKSELSDILKNIKNLDQELKKVVGSLGNKTRIELEEQLKNTKNRILGTKISTKPSEDYSLPSRDISIGKLHPVTLTLREIKKAFVSLGSQIEEGPEIELDKYNFDMLNIPEDKYTTTFQSRLGKDPWLEPYTDQTVEGLAKKGIKKMLVFSPAFVADCLETILEISEENQEIFIENGGEKLDLVPELNDSEPWAKCVVKIIQDYI